MGHFHVGISRLLSWEISYLTLQGDLPDLEVDFEFRPMAPSYSSLSVSV